LVSKSSVVTSVASYAKSTEKSSQVPLSEVRDELVRAVMPELRVLMQHLVNTAVAGAIAPLLDKQRELETALEELRGAQLRSPQSKSTSAKHVPEATPAARAVPTEQNPVVTYAAQATSGVAVAPASAVAIARPTPAASVRTEVVAAAAYDLNALDDVPLELLGSRRKKVVGWAVAVVGAGALAAVIVLSVLSNLGFYR
jgi:hypothetical protein